jgi:hypothetical protein
VLSELSAEELRGTGSSSLAQSSLGKIATELLIFRRNIVINCQSRKS